MADTNITIIFGGGNASGTETNPEVPGHTPSLQSPGEQEKQKNTGGDFGSTALALYLAKQSLTMATSRVGQYKRDDVAQNNVNFFLKLGAYAGAIKANPLMGAIAIGVDLLNNQMNYNFALRQETNRLSILSKKFDTSNRSR